MASLVREATQKLLTIENPLPNPVEIKKEMIVIESETVFVSPKSFTIPPKSVILVLFSNSDWSLSTDPFWQRNKQAN
jgi:hypothetical protein